MINHFVLKSAKGKYTILAGVKRFYASGCISLPPIHVDERGRKFCEAIKKAMGYK